MIKILFARLQGENDLHVCLSYLTTKELSIQNLSKMFVEKCLDNNILAFWCICLCSSSSVFMNCLGIVALESSVVLLEGTVNGGEQSILSLREGKKISHENLSRSLSLG